MEQDSLTFSETKYILVSKCKKYVLTTFNTSGPRSGNVCHINTYSCPSYDNNLIFTKITHAITNLNSIKNKKLSCYVNDNLQDIEFTITKLIVDKNYQFMSDTDIVTETKKENAAQQVINNQKIEQISQKLNDVATKIDGSRLDKIITELSMF